MKILGHRVLLKMHAIKQEEQKSAGGIILSNEMQIKEEDSEKATVVQIGPTAFKELGDGEAWVKVGDIVTIQRYSGKQITRGSDVYRVINDEDLLTIEDEEDAE